MEDFFDDFDNDEFMDEDTEMDAPLDDEPECDHEPEQAESTGDDLSIDPFVIGGAFGFGYEEGLRERKRRKRERFGDDNESD